MPKIKGFSKLSKEAKIDWVINNYFENPKENLALLKGYWHGTSDIQKLHDEFIENTITNYYMPFGVAPNFLINNKIYCLPMAIEESSVVAAMSKSANFWLDRGGFKSTIISTLKTGHVHFSWEGEDPAILRHFIEDIKPKIMSGTHGITKNMEARGGGIVKLELIDKTDLEPHYYQLKGTFETCDSMGANFINSVLEELAKILRKEAKKSELLNPNAIDVIMCILSNYTPECLVRCELRCAIDDLPDDTGISPLQFAQRFVKAVRIAEIEPYRAVTHNKGIMNGIDALIIATGNDFRAIEACAHAYASRNGSYQSLSHAAIIDNQLVFSLEIPLALGTVGGLTSLHPMVKFSHALLGSPGANELMEIVAAAGLAQNFSAIRSLVTTGIQKGHMKMHLLNILNQLGATDEEKAELINYFKEQVPGHRTVVDAFEALRKRIKDS
jgi:hydroxymethylglutaryl-CoA reductase